MKILSQLVRALVFIVLLGFAIKNDGLVTVQGYFGTQWQLPLVVVMLVFFALGLIAGAMVFVGRSVSRNKELQQLRATPPVPPSAPSARAIDTEATSD